MNNRALSFSGLAVRRSTRISVFVLFGLLPLAASPSARSQCQIRFTNLDLASGLDAPVFDTDCVTRLAGAGFVAQLYAGSVGTLPDALQATGQPTPFQAGAPGYWVPINVTPVVPGTSLSVQARVWDTAFGATFEAARTNGGRFGSSIVLTVQCTGLIVPRWQSFCLQQECTPATLAISRAANPSGALALRVRGKPGCTYVLERSEDLTVWTPHATNTLGQEAFWDFMEASPSQPHRFYRSVSQ